MITLSWCPAGLRIPRPFLIDDEQLPAQAANVADATPSLSRRTIFASDHAGPPLPRIMYCLSSVQPRRALIYLHLEK